MSGRTFVVGDVHGDLAALQSLMAKLPAPEPTDTLVFLGDYLDRGPDSAGVIEAVRRMQHHAPCKVVALRGNHEDAWLRVLERGWPEFVLPSGNGCLAALRSFTGRPQPEQGEGPAEDEIDPLFSGSFFPPEVAAWLRTLAWFYEDDHAIYVHAGLVEQDGGFAHPSKIEPPIAMLWTRSESFFRDYRGKRVGHTATETLPHELSQHTPADPKDLWAGENVVAIDTGAGKGGFLTALELPALRVWESR
jgi:serine/threonine protein phosphatase 1